MTNPIIESLLNRKSIRKYTDEVPSDEVITTIARAGQQAPFATQSCSLILSRNRKKHAYLAPLQFTICADHHRLGLIMAKRNWQIVTNDLMLFFYGMQDACLMAENMVVAAESLGLGSCYIGLDEDSIPRLRTKYNLPKLVLPVVDLIMGYPAENPPPRPRYPLDFFLFEDTYPEFTDEQIERAMATMDDGYRAQDYYRKPRLMIKLEGDREETYTIDDYGWTEHISRKWGQWHPSPDELHKEIAACGFDLRGLAAEKV
jgi:nitroreductase